MSKFIVILLVAVVQFQHPREYVVKILDIEQGSVSGAMDWGEETHTEPKMLLLRQSPKDLERWPLGKKILYRFETRINDADSVALILRSDFDSMLFKGHHSVVSGDQADVMKSGAGDLFDLRTGIYRGHMTYGVEY